tara:strand:- start:1141 stop:3000 length:1860 start_codon:yes stop_codon:yes gene_type:complete
MNNIIFFKKNIFQKIFIWSNKFAIKDYAISKKSNINIVENDILTASEYRLADYKASLFEKNHYNKFFKKSNEQKLLGFGDNNFARRLVGQRILQDTKNIYLAIFYAQAIIKKYSIHGEKNFLWSNNINTSLYKYLEGIGEIPNTVKLSRICLYYNYLRNSIKTIYFFIKCLFYTEFKLIFKNKTMIPIKNNYKYLVYMEDGLNGWEVAPNNLLIDNTHIDNKDVLFINNYDSYQEWINDYKKKQYNVFDINNAGSLINSYGNIIIYIRKYFIRKLQLLSLIFRYPWMASTAFMTLKKTLLWDIFYNYIKTDNVISIMNADDLASSNMHRKNKTRSIFIYFSITTNILKNIKNPIVSHYHDYTYMNYDTVISGKVSNDWLKTLQNEVRQYINLGPVFSDLIIKRSNTKSEMLEKLNINGYEKIIAYVDSPTGFIAVSNNNSYEAYIDSLLQLSIMNPSYLYILKTKKKLKHIKSHSNGKIVSLLDEIQNRKNILYANDINLSVYDAMGLSDLTVSGPESSALFESWYAGKKTICFDAYGQYKDSESIENHIPKCKAFSFDELIELHNHWLDQVDQEQLDEYLNQYIKPFFDNKRTKGNDITQLREIICNNCIVDAHYDLS